MPKPTIIVHGGAGSIQQYIWPKYRQGAHDAARHGMAMLNAGASALDAAVGAAIELENNPTFNAGTGSALTLDGTVENDAFVMTDDLHSGAVAAVSGYKNPILLARAVLEHTEHEMMAGPGIAPVAKKAGIDAVDPGELVMELRYKRWQQLIHEGQGFEEALELEPSDDPVLEYSGDEPSDTIGACAVDAEGRIAVASSTGGIMLKLPGRVGDTPIIGAGSYCGPAGAVTCTGHGEMAMRVCLAKYCYDILERGEETEQAVNSSIKMLTDRLDGLAGLIAVDAQGNRAWATSTRDIAVGIPEELVNDPRGALH